MITKVASLLIFLASCLFNPSSYATIPDDQFSQANTYYRQGDFQKAYDLYMNIPEKNAAIYYNLGNCAWKLNKNGYALLFWRRAEKNWGIFGKSELLGNIYLVKNKISLSASQADEAQKPPSLKFIRSISRQVVSFIRSAPLFAIQIIFLLFWVFLFISLKYLYRNRFKGLITVLFICIAVFGGIMALRYNFDLKKYGIAIKQAKVFSGPHENFHMLATLPEGAEVVIVKSSDGYYKVRSGGINGWVSALDVEKV